MSALEADDARDQFRELAAPWQRVCGLGGTYWPEVLGTLAGGPQAGV